MKNKCSIKPIKTAYVGCGVRMTSDKNTEEFRNIPMSNMIIEDYNKQGFFLSHSNLPRKIWVDFDQLPLTRLTIKNGVIEDEITFVENIVRHKMQLIKTSDTEYIDMMYTENELKERKIIPISSAIPGNIYIGAQCKEGVEMIYLGTWACSFYLTQTNYYSRVNRNYLEKKNPFRAFFLLKSNEISYRDKDEIDKKYSHLVDRWPDGYYRWDEDTREEYDKEVEHQKNLAKKDYEELYNSTSHYKLINYSVTSKRIKDLIDINKSDKRFSNKENNKSICLYEPNKNSIQNISIPIYDNCRIINDWYHDFPQFIQNDKENILKNSINFILEHYNIKLEDKFYEDRHMSNYQSIFGV